MKTEEAERYASIALEAARQGAAHALAGFRKPLRIQHKGAVDLVTSFDTSTEQLLRELLAKHTANVPVVAEELGGCDTADLLWYVDPIDGTTNYAHGHPFWAVSIGLLDKGVPLAGAVVAPALSTEWVAWSGGRAHRNGAQCSVSSETNLGEALLATGFPYDRQTSPDNNFVEFEALQKIAQAIRRCGSAALDLCLVADGTYDGYWEKKLKPWDLCAGVAILVSAGGTITALDGSPADVRRGTVAASNGRIHDALLAALGQARDKKREGAL